MFMGEAPGSAEEKTGEAFRGQPGKLLSAILEETGFREDEEVFVCNTLLCRPLSKPKSPELKCCRSNIEAIVRAVSPEVIVPMGNFSLKWLTGKSGIMTWHGSKMESDYGTVIPAIHPSAALRNGARVLPKTKEQQREGIRGFIVTDLEYAKAVLDGTEEEFETSVDVNFNYSIAKEVEDLEKVFEAVQAHEEIAVDIETTGLTFYRDEIIGIAFSWEEGQGVYIPLRTRVDDLKDLGSERLERLHQLHSKIRDIGAAGPGSSGLEDEDSRTPEVLKEWRAKRKKKKKKKGERLVQFWGADQKEVEEFIGAILRIPGKKFYGWNFKFDEKFLAYHFGSGIFRTSGDGLFQSYLLDENTPNDLKSNTDYNIPEMRGYANELRRHTSQSQLDDEKLAHVPLDVLYRYGCGDVDATRRLVRKFNQELARSDGLNSYYRQFYLPLHHAYTAAELEGVLVDHEWVEKVAIDRVEKLDRASREMFEMVGAEFNPNSDKQLIPIVYGKGSRFGVKVPYDEKHLLTDSGTPSVKELTLKWMFYNHPVDSDISRFVRLLLEHRKLSKQMSTYIVGCTDDLDDFGRAHFGFNLIGAVTGRLSCKRIPIQTIPREPLMRGMFVSAPGWRLIEADYMAQELRIASWYSRDPVMNHEFATGADPHLNTASEMFKKPHDEISKHERKLAKSTNFGSLYEGGPTTLADSINDRLDLEDTPVSANDTEIFQEAWAKRYRGFVSWRYKVHSTVKRDKQVVSPLGRVRRLPAVDSEDKKDRAEAMRQGVNSLIQGLGSDIGSYALTRILPSLRAEGLHAHFRWGLHDALFIEAPEGEVVATCEIMQEEQEREIVDGLHTPVEFKVFDERWAGDHIEDSGELLKIKEKYGPMVGRPVQSYSSILTDLVGTTETPYMASGF